MSSDDRVVIALDVGGTSVKAGLVDFTGALVGAPAQFPIQSQGDAETILGGFEAALRALWQTAGGRRVAGIGVGMCGPMDYATGTSLIRGVHKYEAIYGVNLPDDWRRRLRLAAGFPIRFVNDAAAFALGESLFGAGRGRRRVMAVTLGTGCGSAFVVDGKVVRAGEGVPQGGEIYYLPLAGERIDDWISRRGILRLWAAAGGSLEGVDVAEIAAAGASGDRVAREVWSRFGVLLADALGPVADAFRPECLVVGGGIARSLSLYDGPLQARLQCPLVASTDGAAGVKGAASLIIR